MKLQVFTSFNSQFEKFLSDFLLQKWFNFNKKHAEKLQQSNRNKKKNFVSVWFVF